MDEWIYVRGTFQSIIHVMDFNELYQYIDI